MRNGSGCISYLAHRHENKTRDEPEGRDRSQHQDPHREGIGIAGDQKLRQDRGGHEPRRPCAKFELLLGGHIGSVTRLRAPAPGKEFTGASVGIQHDQDRQADQPKRRNRQPNFPPRDHVLNGATLYPTRRLGRALARPNTLTRSNLFVALCPFRQFRQLIRSPERVVCAPLCPFQEARMWPIAGS